MPKVSSVRRSGREETVAARKSADISQPQRRPNNTGGQLPPLEQPKYTAPEPSFLCKFIVFPIYDTIVVFYPRWWTPNGITLFGIFCTVVASVLILTGMPAFDPDVGSSSQHPPASSLMIAGSQYMRDLGLAANSSTFGYCERAAALGLGRWAYEHSRGTPSFSPAVKGLYNKQIALVPNSVVTVCREIVDKVTADSNAAASPKAFTRPVPFVDSLTFGVPKFKVVLMFIWNSVTSAADAFLSKHLDQANYATVRTVLFEYVETPVTFITSTFIFPYLAAVEAFLVGSVPAAVVASPGRGMLFVAGVLNLIYCIADNTDGRHARRTKRTSHIGEYLDHGLDCVTSLLSTFILVAALGAEAYYAAWAVLSVALVTVCCHIVHQEQGVMIWGNRFFSVDEAMLAFGLGLMGVSIWYPSFIAMTIPVQWISTTIGIPIALIPATLINTRIVEVCLVLFVMSQLQVFLSIVGCDKSILVRPSAIFMYANIAVLVILTNTMGAPSTDITAAFRHIAKGAMARGGFELAEASSPVVSSAPAVLVDVATFVQRQMLGKVPSQVIYAFQVVDIAVSTLFAYEAQWVVVAACTCSVIVHQPIIGKCLHKARGVSLAPMLVSLPLTWVTFFFVSSALGTAVAVATHAAQVLWNIHLLEARARAVKKH